MLLAAEWELGSVVIALIVAGTTVFAIAATIWQAKSDAKRAREKAHEVAGIVNGMQLQREVSAHDYSELKTAVMTGMTKLEAAVKNDADKTQMLAEQYRSCNDRLHDLGQRLVAVETTVKAMHQEARDRQ